MCVMCESQRNRIPSWKKGRGSVLSGVLQLVQVSHMSLLLQSGKHPYRVLCSNTTGSLFHSIWVSQEGGQGGTSNHHESLASHPNPCIPVVPVYTCVCYSQTCARCSLGVWSSAGLNIGNAQRSIMCQIIHGVVFVIVLCDPCECE